MEHNWWIGVLCSNLLITLIERSFGQLLMPAGGLVCLYVAIAAMHPNCSQLISLISSEVFGGVCVRSLMISIEMLSSTRPPQRKEVEKTRRIKRYKS